MLLKATDTKATWKPTSVWTSARHSTVGTGPRSSRLTSSDLRLAKASQQAMGRATRLRKEHTPTGPDTNTGDRKQLRTSLRGHGSCNGEPSLQHGPSVYARRGQRPLSPAAATTAWSPPTLGREACDTCQGALFPLWGFREENGNRGGSASSWDVSSSTRQMHVVGMGGHAAEEGAQLQEARDTPGLGLRLLELLLGDLGLAVRAV